jgi:putative transposase
MCDLAKVSRASFYRSGKAPTADPDEMELRDSIQRIALTNRRYGYRRVTAELRRQGYLVNHKRVARLMRLDNLLAVTKRKFRPPTTDSRHRYEIYLNLAARLNLTGPDQLWVADITYVRLRREFVYVAVVLDAWSRKVIGWHADATLKADLPLAALSVALQRRKPRPGLVHHSDRGVQYACEDYLKVLAAHNIEPSMSRGGTPTDNAISESFIKTLKTEEVDGCTYETLAELRQHLAEFIDGYYNAVRLHSALGYRPPQEFEQSDGLAKSQAAVLSFLGHKEICHFDVA